MPRLTTTTPTARPGARRPRGRRRFRRGVVSVLSMMFLILFGSLTAAMAIASQGNIKAAATHLHVMRAMGAADTGLAIAAQRLAEASSRFVISHSDMNADAVLALWTGDLEALGTVEVLPPPSGHAEDAEPGSLAEALGALHAAEGNVIEYGGVDTPTISDAPDGFDEEIFAGTDWVVTPVISLEALSSDEDAEPTQIAYQIVYAPLADGTGVRAIVTGYDFAYQRSGQPLTRVVSQDFRIGKRVAHAVISPSRIMIGKNVHISGDLGARYEDVDWENGDPVTIRSDFSGLDDDLDDKLTDFYEAVAGADVDGDNRLRVNHPTEGAAIPDADGGDYNGDPDTNPFADVTGDGYLDELDIFIGHYDTNKDGMVALSDALRAGTPHADLEAEFVDVDDDLAVLIDSVTPDRNRSGVYGFVDADGDGRWDSDSETLLDHDDTDDVYRDQALGYLDGVIDALDRYTKVRGSLKFRISSNAWTGALGDYHPRVLGAIRATGGSSPIAFDQDDTKLPDISADSFSDDENALREASDGDDFWTQVAENLGIDADDLATYEESGSAGNVRYFRLDPDADADGLPDNWETAYFEKAPYNSPAHNDYYYRPVFEKMVFHDVQVPMGLNGLFIDCTFVGATYVRTTEDNTHILWTVYGKMEMDPDTGRPKPVRARYAYGDDGDEPAEDSPPVLPETAIPPSRLISIASDPLDKGDVLESQIGSFAAGQYDSLPDACVIEGLRVTDSKLYSNNVRFHGCLFVGSIVSDTPDTYTHVRNKLQFTGSTRFAQAHPDEPDEPDLNPDADDLAELAKSSMMLPNYSVDIGSFNSPADQNVSLRGAIIAGVLDVRGNATIDGALLLTFRPEMGEGPLVDIAGNPIGSPAGFNTTLGYFGPEDGDGESLDPESLPIVDGQRIVGYDTDGDGLADVGPDEDQPEGSEVVPFHGYGRIELRFDPDMTLPNGIMLPVSISPVVSSYREGSQ